jgi:8-oxo-dGTP diphosphatase
VSYTYDYPMFSVTTDVAVFQKNGSQYEILVIERGQEPCKGMVALPGGYVNIDETIKNAAARELQEETGLSVPIPFLRPIGVYDSVNRDPRGRTISYAWVVFVFPTEVLNLKAGDDAKSLRWLPVDEILLTNFAFDHKTIAIDAFTSLIK